MNTLWYHQHPADAERVAAMNSLSRRKAEPERGRPAYHYNPREIVLNMSTLLVNVPELQEYEDRNNKMKKDSMLVLAAPETYHAAVKADWDHYCEMFQPSRPDVKHPEYPYTVEMMKDMIRQEEELEEMEKERMKKRYGGIPGQDDTTEEEQADYDGPPLIPALEPGDFHTSLEPARAVLRAYEKREA